MAKLTPQNYKDSKGNSRVSGYVIRISKSVGEAIGKQEFESAELTDDGILFRPKEDVKSVHLPPWVKKTT